MILLDVNVLVYAHRAEMREHPPAANLLNNLVNGDHPFGVVENGKEDAAPVAEIIGNDGAVLKFEAKGRLDEIRQGTAADVIGLSTGPADLVVPAVMEVPVGL